MALGIHHVDKPIFLELFLSSEEDLSSKNITSGFKATGLSSTRSESGTCPAAGPPPTETPSSTLLLKTPANMLELDRLQRRRQLGVSLADRALQKYHQRLPMTMHNATLLLEENSRLRTENTRQKRKRAQRRVFLQTGGAMTVEEGMASVETVQKDQGGLESHPGDEGRLHHKCENVRIQNAAFVDR